MWKKSVYALILGSVLLVGCNNNDEATDDNTFQRDMDNVGEGINEGVNDAQRAVEDVVDPDQYNRNGGNNNDNELFDDANRNRNGNGADYDVNDNAVDGTRNNTGVNGTDNRIINDNDEDIFEDREDRKDRDKVDE